MFRKLFNPGDTIKGEKQTLLDGKISPVLFGCALSGPADSRQEGLNVFIEMISVEGRDSGGLTIMLDREAAVRCD